MFVENKNNDGVTPCISRRFYYYFLIMIGLTLSSSLAHANKVKKAREMFFNAVSEAPIDRLKSRLQEMNIDVNNVPKDVLKDLERAVDHPSELFYTRNGTTRVYKDPVASLDSHPAYRAFFFDKFDSGIQLIEFCNAFVHSLKPQRLSSPQIMTATLEKWKKLKGIVQTAIQERYFFGSLNDFEAAMFTSMSSALDRSTSTARYLSHEENMVYRTIADDIIFGKPPEELAQLVASRSFLVAPEQISKMKIFQSIRKSDLTTGKAVLEWWGSINIMVRARPIAAGSGEFNYMAQSILQNYLRSSYRAAREASRAGSSAEEYFGNDPFIMALFDAMDESDANGLLQAFNRSIEQLREIDRRSPGLLHPDFD